MLGQVARNQKNHTACYLRILLRDATVVGLMVVATNQQFKPLCVNVFFASSTALKRMGGGFIAE